MTLHGDDLDQKPLWDAYGHAMGAAVGLELLLRVALINNAARKLAAEGRLGQQEDRERAVAQIQKMTLGPTVSEFKKAFPELDSDTSFSDSLTDAVSSRNHLAHGFLEGILLGLRSAEGIELATLGCLKATEHFRALGNFVRERCPVDYDEFFKLGDGREDEFVQGHPLLEELRAMKLVRADTKEN